MKPWYEARTSGILKTFTLEKREIATRKCHISSKKRAITYWCLLDKNHDYPVKNLRNPGIPCGILVTITTLEGGGGGLLQFITVRNFCWLKKLHHNSPETISSAKKIFMTNSVFLEHEHK